MDKTESDNQENIGTLRKCSEYPYLGCNLHLLIVAEIKHALISDLSIYEIMQILSISSFDKTPIAELLPQTQVNQNIKEQLNLFSNNFERISSIPL